MKYALATIVLLALTMLWVRYSPTNTLRWHIDPMTAPLPGRAGFAQRPDSADGPGKTYAMSAKALLDAFDSVALSTPRTRLLAHDGLRATYVTRSAFWGFPDYTTVQAVASGDGAQLVILARLRFGASDLGVNRARVLGWLAELDTATGS